MERLTLKLSGARSASQPKLLYRHRRFPPTFNEDVPRVRSNDWLDRGRRNYGIPRKSIYHPQDG